MRELCGFRKRKPDPPPHSGRLIPDQASEVESENRAWPPLEYITLQRTLCNVEGPRGSSLMALWFSYDDRRFAASLGPLSPESLISDQALV